LEERKINQQYTKHLRKQLTPQFSTPASYTQKMQGIKLRTIFTTDLTEVGLLANSLQASQVELCSVL
jgi:hypothetical protein